MKKRFQSAIMKAALAVALLTLGLSGTKTHAASPLPTDVDTPASDCVFLGIEGKYIEQIDKAIKRINEIRYEACKEGVPNPASSDKPLTMGDYVPIKWSSDLEYIARIRAAEASVTMDHARANGRSIWELAGPRGATSSGEVIAWNWTETMLAGIEQWYGEKSDWVSQNPYAVTGHYTQMIDPGHLYVGLGTFCSGLTKYYNTTVGEFSYAKTMDETRGTGVKKCVQTLEVKKDYLSNKYDMAGGSTMKSGEKKTLTVTTSVTMEDYWGNALKTDGLQVLSSLVWTSSDKSILSVNSKGVVTANKCGTATIRAKDKAGHSAEMKVTSLHNYSTKWTVDKPATATENGSKSHHCLGCQAKKDVTAIRKIKSVALKAKTFECTGEALQPGVTVKDSDGKEISSKYYTVTYPSNSGALGTHTVKITFQGDYSGTKELKYQVVLKTPGGIQATQSTTSVTLTWDSVPGADFYKIYKYNSEIKKYENVAMTGTAKAVIKHLKSGKTYKFKVVAVDKSGKRKSASSKVFSTATRCAAPKLKVTSPERGAAKITWGKVSGATGYTLYYSTSANGGFRKLATLSGTGYTCQSLKRGQTYYFRAVTIKKVEGVTIKSATSDVKSVKIK